MAEYLSLYPLHFQIEGVIILETKYSWASSYGRNITFKCGRTNLNIYTFSDVLFNIIASNFVEQKLQYCDIILFTKPSRPFQSHIWNKYIVIHY